MLRAWQELIPFFAFDPAIRKNICSTKAIKSLNRVIRNSIKTRGSFPTQKAATNLIYLAIRNFETGGGNVRQWFAARNQFAIMCEESFNPRLVLPSRTKARGKYNQVAPFRPKEDTK